MRAWFLFPHPDEDAFFQEGRSVERDVLKTHPNPRLPPGPGNTASELGSGDHSKARSKCRSRWIRTPTRWPVTSRSRSRSGAILYSYRWQCDQCLLAVVGPGLRFTVMSFLSFGVKETGGYAAGITSEHLSIDRTNERTNEQWAMGEISIF